MKEMQMCKVIQILSSVNHTSPSQNRKNNTIYSQIPKSAMNRRDTKGNRTIFKIHYHI